MGRSTLVFFGFASALSGQARFEIHVDTRYVLKVPVGHEHWVVSKESSDAAWCYGARDNRRDLESLCGFKTQPRYVEGSPVTVERLTDCCVRVALEGGSIGWVARELVELTPEQRKAYEARQAALAKERAERLAQERARQKKEQAYTSTLPKLSNSSGEVLVATSRDCARDYEKIIQLGRRNGTGVEFRKRLLELMAVGCAVEMPSGTAIEVIDRRDGFVEFRAYDGPKKGTHGFALSAHVR